MRPDKFFHTKFGEQFPYELDFVHAGNSSDQKLAKIYGKVCVHVLLAECCSDVILCHVCVFFLHLRRMCHFQQICVLCDLSMIYTRACFEGDTSFQTV